MPQRTPRQPTAAVTIMERQMAIRTPFLSHSSLLALTPAGHLTWIYGAYEGWCLSERFEQIYLCHIFLHVRKIAIAQRSIKYVVSDLFKVKEIIELEQFQQHQQPSLPFSLFWSFGTLSAVHL